MPDQESTIKMPNFQLPLVVDVSSSPLQVGIPQPTGWLRIETDPEQAMEGLFRATQKLFQDQPDDLNAIDAVYYCCGPGSTLSLRLAAAFVKTLLWEAKGRISLFQYNALDLAACMTKESINSIQAPFRMGKRFVRTGKVRAIGQKNILLEEDALEKYPQSLHILGPRAIAIEIPEAQILKYDLNSVNGLTDLNLVSETAEQPAPYSPEPMTFKKWEGVIPAKK
jgi:tRNA A37 threonylcarbamoyladenosine modification protein TsaB